MDNYPPGYAFEYDSSEWEEWCVLSAERELSYMELADMIELLESEGETYTDDPAEIYDKALRIMTDYRYYGDYSDI